MLVIIVTFCVIIGITLIAFLVSILKSGQRADRFEERIINIIQSSNANIDDEQEESEEVNEEIKKAKVFA